MLNRQGLFPFSLSDKQLAIFQGYILHCMDRVRRLQPPSSIAECSEPCNPPLDAEPPAAALPKTNSVASSSLTTTLLKYGCGLMGLSSFFKTASAEIIFILPGIPKHQAAWCDPSQWVACIESFIANETDVLGRFMLAEKAYFNNSITSATNYVGNKLAATPDPLLQILKAMLLYLPGSWQRNATECESAVGDADANALFYGNTTAISPPACQLFQAVTLKVGRRYMLDYFNEVARVDALPATTPDSKIVIIMFAVAILVTMTVTPGLGYMAGQLKLFHEQQKREQNPCSDVEDNSEDETEEIEEKEEKAPRSRPGSRRA